MLVVIGPKSDIVTRVLVDQLAHLFPCYWVKPDELGRQVVVTDKGFSFYGHWLGFDKVSVCINRLLEIPIGILARNDSWQKLLTAMESRMSCVLNRPSIVMGNFFKPQQLKLIERFFTIPETKVLLDEPLSGEAHVIKSMSSVRSVVVKSTDLPDLWAYEPVLSQRLMHGYHVRVHVIGDICRVCRIDATSVDYRYCADALFSTFTCPDWLIAQSVRMVKAMGATFAGIDFMVSENHDWVCLEVNLAPGFTYYDEKLKKPEVLGGLVQWIETQY